MSESIIDDVFQRHQYFRRLLVRDPKLRHQAIQDIVQDLGELLQQLKNIDSKSNMNEIYAERLQKIHPTIARLAQYAPFQDIRQAFQDMEIQLRTACKIQPSALTVSRFILSEDLVKLYSENKETDEDLLLLLQNTFLRTGRISNLVRILAWHKTYLISYRLSTTQIMTEDGPLPQMWCNYIAIMAASQLRCGYVLAMQQHYFLINGGDRRWLRGLAFAPSKLTDLLQLNVLLAHRPWLITKQHIQTLMESTVSPWSVTELVHAIVIMCTAHSTCSLAMSLGCAPEKDLPLLVFKDDSLASYSDELETGKFWEYKVPGISSGDDSSDSENLPTAPESDADILQRLVHAREDVDRFVDEISGEQDSDIEPFENAGNRILGRKRRHSQFIREPFRCYCEPRTCSILEYEDFDVRSKEYGVLHTEDFSWDEHGFSLLSRYFPTAAHTIDDQFKLIFKLTYASYGKHSEIDTTPFRRAVWYYVQRIFGICHDDYRYNEVNAFMGRPVKCFVKKTACRPWKLQPQEFSCWSSNKTASGNQEVLTSAEKCHVALLTSEARKQAGLLYGLRAIMEHKM